MFNIIDNDSKDICRVCFDKAELLLSLDEDDCDYLICEDCLQKALDQLKDFATNKLAAKKAEKILLDKGFDPTELELLTYDEILKLANVEYLEKYKK